MEGSSFNRSRSGIVSGGVIERGTVCVERYRELLRASYRHWHEELGTVEIEMWSDYPWDEVLNFSLL